MSFNLQAERVYDQIEIGRGIGSRWQGQLCIMSLVAFLAGDRHTDQPQTASPFIRNFAIQLNDGVPERLRPNLKPFAPRIIGTNDGQDLERAAILFRKIETEVLPRAMSDFRDSQKYARFEFGNKTLLRVSAVWRDRCSSERIGACFRVIRDEYERGDCNSLARKAGKLLVTLVQCAPHPSAQRWYWAKSLELVDHLCDVGAAPGVGVERATAILEHYKSPLVVANNAERRPMQKVSRMLRTVIHLMSA